MGSLWDWLVTASCPLVLGVPPSANPTAQATTSYHGWASDPPPPQGSRGHPSTQTAGVMPQVPGRDAACKSALQSALVAARLAPPHPPVQRGR